MAKKKVIIPTKHKYKPGQTVVFEFAGNKRIGQIEECTFDKENDKRLHYSIRTKDTNRIYPQIGENGSEVNSIFDEDQTKLSS